MAGTLRGAEIMGCERVRAPFAQVFPKNNDFPEMENNGFLENRGAFSRKYFRKTMIFPKWKIMEFWKIRIFHSIIPKINDLWKTPRLVQKIGPSLAVEFFALVCAWCSTTSCMADSAGGAHENAHFAVVGPLLGTKGLTPACGPRVMDAPDSVVDQDTYCR